MKNKLFTCLGALFIGVLLTGCGGGGGGSGSAPGDDSLTTQARRLSSETTSKLGTNTPKSGSVTQSSNGDGATTDTMGVTLFFSGDGRINYRLEHKGDREVTITGSGSSTARRFQVTEASGEDRYWIAFGTDLTTAVTTQTQLGTNTNWLAGGFWALAPVDITDPNDIEFGVFVDGGDPFDETKIAGLSGDADYQGEANGFFHIIDRSEGDVFFEFVFGTANLNANFNTNLISGTITGLSYDNEEEERIEDIGFDINLEETAIGTTDSGFFTGDTSVDSFTTSDGKTLTFSGKWGGQFFGNGVSDTDKPSKVGGTFGGECDSSDCDDDYQINFGGFFGAELQ